MNEGFNHGIFLQNLTSQSGVYQMYDCDNTLLYVGKARDLKKRVSSYFRKSGLSTKNQSLMGQVVDIKVIVTNSETEALILENNLIKENHPKYNILLRDDKTYPFIHLTDETFPRLRFHRGRRSRSGRYFGPYPNSSAVKETLELIYKVFKIRNCKNSLLSGDYRPCLLHQIGRCVHPLADNISPAQYQLYIDDIVAFLEGKNRTLISNIEIKMTQAAENLDFENAAMYRDQLQALQKILEKQYITNDKGDADVIALVGDNSATVIQVFYYRGGRSLGTQAYFPKTRPEHSESEIIQRFIEHMYADKAPPKQIITNHKVSNEDLLKDFFSEKFSQTVNFVHQPREYRLRWLKLAVSNAELSLSQKKISAMTLSKQFAALTESLALSFSPKLMACVDVSHTQGEATVASYVVFDEQGPKKSDYRKYNITGEIAGDDYGAMEQLLTRRFARFIKQEKGQVKNDADEKRPDILFVDGGLGQFHVAERVFEKLGITNVLIVGVAKGADRKAGMERLIVGSDDNLIKLNAQNPAMHLIQQIRDESHRFAITGHRKKRDKKRFESVLKEIEGIGDKRRQSLLKYFAGINGVKNASCEELQKVDGISPVLAAKIYDYFH
ncbi:MAG: excinuclease ABC subunit UvrC [Gammaproteobacteria bacterium]|nr:excinuclease ABC subunit UvrC [Gammaproteobacteria bacterium]